MMRHARLCVRLQVGRGFVARRDVRPGGRWPGLLNQSEINRAASGSRADVEDRQAQAQLLLVRSWKFED